jgi:hypothetical protein
MTEAYTPRLAFWLGSTIDRSTSSVEPLSSPSIKIDSTKYALSYASSTEKNAT